MTPDPPDPSAELRRQAEARLDRQSPGAGVPSLADALPLLHELQVHQIELEMQQDELQQARDRLEAERAHYLDLYDFAPCGYLTMDVDGHITQINLTGALLFGTARALLTGKRFASFVAADDLAALDRWLVQRSRGESTVAIEVRLVARDRPDRLVHLVARRADESAEYRLTMEDVTEIRAVEAANQAQLAELQQWYQVMLGREERLLELKREVDELRLRLGEPLRYATAGDDPGLPGG